MEVWLSDPDVKELCSAERIVRFRRKFGPEVTGVPDSMSLDEARNLISVWEKKPNKQELKASPSLTMKMLRKKYLNKVNSKTAN